MIACAAEGVLVFIEQHNPEGGAHRCGHLRHLGGQLGCYGHLVGELDQPEPALSPGHGPGWPAPGAPGRRGRLLDVGVHIAAIVEAVPTPGREQVAGVPVQIIDVDEMLLKVGVKPQHPLGDRGRSQPRR